MGASGETAAADVVAATAPVVRMTGVAEDTAPVTHGTVAAEMTVAGTVAAATVAAGMVAEDVFAATAAMDTAAAAETPAAAESVAGTAPAEPALPEGVLEDGSVELSPDEAELHEIFMMEATEVLDAIAENLVIVRRAPDDREAMTTIRRGFHTLKGSSRMVGLDAFGEAAWAFEQMMNHWLAEDRDGTPALFELIGEGADFFRRWAEQLQVAPRRVLDASLLVARCNAFPDKPAAVEKSAVTEKPAAPQPAVVQPAVAQEPAPEQADLPVAEQADLSALGMDAADPFGSGDLSVDGALNPDDESLPTLDLDNALNLGDGPSGDLTLGDASSMSFDGESSAEFDEISLDSDVPADMPVVAKDDGFSSSHNFARVSHAAGEGDVRQQLEGFLDEASDWKAEMLPTDLAELHSDPVRAPEPKTESEEESGDDALFGGPAFDSDVSFDAPQFSNDAAFDDPRFSSDASFDAPPFGSDVAFDGIMSFGGELKLDETVDQGLDAGLSFGSDALSGEPGLSAGWPDAAADGDLAKMRRDTSKTIRTISTLTFICSTGLVALAVPIARVLAFTVRPQETVTLARVVIAMSLGLVGIGAVTALDRVYYAFEDTRGAFWINLPFQVLGLLGFAACSTLPPQWTVVGVGMVMSITNTLSMFAMIWKLSGRMGGMEEARLLRVHVLLMGISAVTVCTCWLFLGFLSPVFAPISFTGAVIRLAVVGPLLVAMFLGLMKAFNMEELTILIGPARSLLRKFGIGK